MSEIAKCRVCGKDFEVCTSYGRSNDPFNWKKIACSEECGEEYFRRIIESREEKVEPRKKVFKRPAHNEKYDKGVYESDEKSENEEQYIITEE